MKHLHFLHVLLSAKNVNNWWSKRLPYEVVKFGNNYRLLTPVPQAPHFGLDPVSHVYLAIWSSLTIHILVFMF